MSKVKVPSVTELVTRSPIELFWTAKKHPVIEQKPMIWVTTRKMMKPMVMAKMKPVAIGSISSHRDIKIRGNGRVKIIASQ